MSLRGIGITLALLAATAGQAQVHYRDFHNTTGLNLVGGAAVVDNHLRLVPARRDSRGNVWTQKALPVAQGFTASFAFRYWHHGGSTDGNGNLGNDGLRFIIQPLSNVLQQNTDVPPRSLFVFFDAYKNNNVGDVSSSRVEVQVNAARLGQTDLEPLGVHFRAGKVVHARIEYDGHSLAVFVNNKPAIKYENVDLRAISPGYIGFHGMGGDAYADVDIMNLQFDVGGGP
jgi:hypothetical protein